MWQSVVSSVHFTGDVAVLMFSSFESCIYMFSLSTNCHLEKWTFDEHNVRTKIPHFTCSKTYVRSVFQESAYLISSTFLWALVSLLPGCAEQNIDAFCCSTFLMPLECTSSAAQYSLNSETFVLGSGPQSGWNKKTLWKLLWTLTPRYTYKEKKKTFLPTLLPF